MDNRATRAHPTAIQLLRPAYRRLLCTLFLLALSSSSVCARARHATGSRASAKAASLGFSSGPIDYFAGNPSGSGTYSDGSLPTLVPLFNAHSTVTDSAGNVYIAEQTSIYVVYGGGTIPASLANVTTKATPAVTPQAGRIYQVAGFGANCGSCEGMPLNHVDFSSIVGLAIDSADNLYYSDAENPSAPVPIADVVRKVDASTSIVTTIAGQWGVDNSSFSTTIGDGGPATSATLYFPEDIKIDKWGNLFIDDNFDDEVRVVYLGSQSPPLFAAEGITVSPAQKGYIYNVAGQPVDFCASDCGDGGLATTAGLGYEFSIAVDPAGNLYIADAIGSSGPYIRMVYAGGQVPAMLNLYLNPGGGSASAPNNGFIYPVTGYGATPVYGPCSAAPCGDGGLAGGVTFGQTSSGTTSQYLETDSSGALYIADEYGYAVRKIDSTGLASTIAGVDDPFQVMPCSNTVPGPAAGICLGNPAGVSFDARNNLYVTDSNLVWRAAPLQPQTIDFPAFSPSSVLYGAAPVALDATASSGLPVQYSVTSTPAGIAHLNGTALVITGVGTVTVTATQGGDTSYGAASPVAEMLAVAPAPLTVTANDASKVQGAPNPAFSATISGFVNGDTPATPSAYAGAPGFSTTATTNSPYGAYPITPAIGTLRSTDYTFPASNFIAGTLTVTGNTPQTISFPAFYPSTVPYGHAPIGLNATSSSGGPVSFVLVSGPGVLSGADGSLLTITGAGSIVVQATQQGYKQYAAAQPVTQTLTVAPAQLTVTGPTVSISYGIAVDPSAFPPATVMGFVGSDAQGSVLTGSAQYSTVSGTPNAGTYPISVALGTLTLVQAAANNYTFATPVDGKLIVEPAAQTISFNPIPTAQSYGGLVPLTAAASSGLPVTFTESGPAAFYNGNNAVLELTAIGTVTVTAAQPGNANYLPAASVSQVLQVGRAPLNITAFGASREQGAPNPDFTYQIGCSLPISGCFVLSDTDVPSVISGVPALTTSATPDSPPGSYPIIVSAGTLVAPNYSFVFLDGTLTVTPPGSFTITATPGSLTIPSGLSGQATLTITPANFYQGTVTLSCGQLPANVSCVISPSTYTFPGNQAPPGVAPVEYSAQGTITISASGSSIVRADHVDRSVSAASFWPIPAAIAALLLAFTRRRLVQRFGIWTALALVAFGAGLLMFSSCGGSSHSLNAAPGTSQVIVSGSGTSITGGAPVTATLPLTVTVQ